MIAKGIAFEHGDNGKSVNALCLWCCKSGFPRKFFNQAKDVPPDWLPYGNVPWTEAVLGRQLVPDYLPAFLSSFVNRKTWVADKWPLGHRVHVKPADRYKRFTGFVTTGTWKGRKKGPLLCSEPITILNEWRYYVANGKVLAAHWYWGDEQNTPEAPPLAIDWPDDFCGAVDFAGLPDGRIELLEAHHPIAAGWYGSLAEGEVFARWLDEGWCSLNSARC